MTSKTWIKEIKKQMTLKNVDYSGFENVIQTLSELLEQRDKIFKQYQDEGSIIMVEYTSNRGETNMVINPLLKEWQNMNRDALVYWRELGLTPAGLRKILDDSMNKPEASPLDKVLENLERQSAPVIPKKPKTVKKTTTKTVAKTKGKNSVKK